MSDDTPRHEMTFKRVLYPAEGSDKVAVQKTISYSAADDGRTLDVYYPPHADVRGRAPAVLFVSGLADRGAQRILGCRINEMESVISWARLVAVSGLVGIAYATDADAAVDTRAVLSFLRTSGASYGIDAGRLGIWACSSHVPNALGVLLEHPEAVRCAALCYGFMLDLDGASGVADAQRTWRFANPASGKRVADLPHDVPLFVARAGQDATPHVNGSIDAFVTRAIQRNLPLTFVNHHSAPHAFDLEDDSEATRHVIALLLGFLERHLTPAAPSP